MGFTLYQYRKLIEALISRGFVFHKVCDYHVNKNMRINANRFVLLRQDVDRLPGNSLAFARIQRELRIKSTFYFRAASGSFDEEIMKKIEGMGHEVGYHYEDLNFAAQSMGQRACGRESKVSRQSAVRSRQEERSGDKIQDTRHKIQVERGSAKENQELGTQNADPLFEAGIESFVQNLEMLRKYVDVKSICMHGSPLSRWDSRLLWKYYDYREFGIECEPYFDFDFSEMLYLTDTGRRWDGSSVSVRDKGLGHNRKIQDTSRNIQVEQGNDKANLEPGTCLYDEASAKAENMEPFADWKAKPVPGSLMNMTEESATFQDRYNFRSTNDIIRAAEQGLLPDKMMMTFHPQRWTDRPLPWMKELIWQNTKNIAKYFLIQIRNK